MDFYTASINRKIYKITKTLVASKFIPLHEKLLGCLTLIENSTEKESCRVNSFKYSVTHRNITTVSKYLKFSFKKKLSHNLKTERNFECHLNLFLSSQLQELQSSVQEILECTSYNYEYEFSSLRPDDSNKNSMNQSTRFKLKFLFECKLECKLV